ncbi:MAG: PfkB family carbohydrate kinase [Candidatus Dormibacteraeota bacterium]|nr:PfkB family carbohydrate kinase [Candidatus Dormibacteraeota bacterium]
MNELPPIRRLVSHGSIPVDLAIGLPHLPERGGDVLAAWSAKSAGGGFNVLSAAVRLGLPAVYAGPHGVGPFGDIVRAALAAEGIACQQPPNPNLDTGYCVVLVEGGERTFVTVSGADAVVDKEMLQGIAYRDGDAIYVSGYDLAYPDAGVAVTEHVASLPAGSLLVFDPGPLVAEIPAALVAAVLERADLVSLNAPEANLLGSGEVLLGRLRPGAAIVLRAGADGATILRAGVESLSVRAPATRVVDNTGAGDVHVGALMAGLARGLGLAEATLLANRAAAYSVGQRGAAAGPTQKQLEEFGAGRW